MVPDMNEVPQPFPRILVAVRLIRRHVQRPKQSQCRPRQLESRHPVK